MKKIIMLLLLASSMSGRLFSQDDLPVNTGDNFSLEGALAMFKKSANLEDFEKALNEEGNDVNNLDLNGDDKIDYIVVKDIKDGETHVIVLSTYLNENEMQDIATIGIEKTGNESAVLQIEGDESLYEANTIAEPQDLEEAPASKSKGGPSVSELVSTSMVVNVWLWPSVRFLYSPRYVVWTSPYRWGKYPGWWRPWKPYTYNIFYTRSAPHQVSFHRTHTQRVIVARRVYTPRRHASNLVVHNRRGTTVIHKNNNNRVIKAKTVTRGKKTRKGR